MLLPNVAAARIDRPDFDAAVEVVDVDAQRFEQPLGLLGIAVPDALGGLDPDLGAAAAGDADVAGEVRQVERAAPSPTLKVCDTLSICSGPWRGLGVALEPAGARSVFGHEPRSVTAAVAGDAPAMSARANSRA